MPAFIHQFASEVHRKADRFAASFDAHPQNPTEQMLQDQLLYHWNDLPTDAPLEDMPAYAVDGASAQRSLWNGSSLLVCQSLLAGRGIEESRVCVEILRGGGDTLEPNRALDRLRTWSEYALAVDHLDRLAGGMLLIDGSLLSQISHCLYLRPTPLGDFHDLRIDLLESCLRLMEGCRERNILLVGISKSARSTLLAGSLLDHPTGDGLLCDAEILNRFVPKAGYTHPILLGRDGLDVERPNAEPTDLRVMYAARIANLPCIGVFYLRLCDGENALRIDVMGNNIGCDETILSFDRRWGDFEAVQPVVQRLCRQHGGPSVYNAPLYAVDRMVRLHGDTVDGAYMAVLREATGQMILSDRSTRRFQTTY